jgi:transcriptional regulator of acetoin/glycerol metabolism
MSSFLQPIREPVGDIVPLDEVKRRTIVDAIDKCGGNYRLAARFLGIGKTTVYRMARQYNYQQRQQARGQPPVDRFAS